MPTTTHVYKEPFDLGTIPDQAIEDEFKKRRAELRRTLGPHATKMKILTCPHCNVSGSTREMRGHACQPRAKLTPAQIRKLRKDFEKGDLSMGQLALNYNISVMSAWLIVNGRLHGDVK